MASRSALGNIARPDLPLPNCRVRMVCGPPAAGKSTYVRAHARPDDIVIDLDTIAKARGIGRERPPGVVRELLQERNACLAALASEPRERVAWVILGAPSKSLREWWRINLGASPADVIVLVPTRAELRCRILDDPDRADVRVHHLMLVDQWFARERDDDPGVTKSGYDASGHPTDPLHPWNRSVS